MTRTLQIVADENIPLVREAFSAFGTVTLRPGRSLTAAEVAGADVLLVRSVTRVDARLLGGSGVRFVGTATIGTDHVDLPWLEAAGIAFASAPGSNAESVAGYITCALLELAARLDRPLRGATVGVVGVGNVGRRVVAKLDGLGARALLNDPPRARAEGPGAFVELAQVQREADLITLHVPLTVAGPDRTLHLVDDAFLAALKPGCALINTSRGDVVVEQALLAALAAGRVHAALDVWEGEPGIDPALLARVAIGTPHIAGYGLDGKIRGTTMLVDALRRHLGAGDAFDPDPLLPAPLPALIVAPDEADDEAALRGICRQAYDLLADDRRLRDTLTLDDEARRRAFDALRKHYPPRREFDRLRVAVDPGRTSLIERCRKLGFQVEPPSATGAGTP